MESYISFRVTGEDKELIYRVAEAQGQDVSSFCRGLVLAACARAPTPLEAAVETRREELFGHRRRS